MIHMKPLAHPTAEKPNLVSINVRKAKTWVDGNCRKIPAFHRPIGNSNGSQNTINQLKRYSINYCVLWRWMSCHRAMIFDQALDLLFLLLRSSKLKYLTLLRDSCADGAGGGDALDIPLLCKCTLCSVVTSWHLIIIFTHHSTTIR